MLETDRMALAKTIAGASGFRDEDTMRRAFVRHLNVTPSQYRARSS
jgi:transcriptional regulator GlxA family with amidase domain